MNELKSKFLKLQLGLSLSHEHKILDRFSDIVSLVGM